MGIELSRKEMVDILESLEIKVAGRGNINDGNTADYKTGSCG